MSKLLRQTLKTAPIALGTSLLIANGAGAAQTTETEAATESPAPALEIAQEINSPSNSDLLQQIESYSSDSNPLGQSTQGASKFRDVRPTDWAFQALDDLIERYDCLVGYPDGTFRGNRPLTRYEFAAGLNACLNQIERLIAEATADFVTREDLEVLRRLLQEFEAELATLGTRVDNLEARTAFLEDHQFSTTTKLRSIVIFNLADQFADTTGERFDTNFNRIIDPGDNYPQRDNTVFALRARLNFDTSFTGKDLLRVRLLAGNFVSFTGPNAGGAPTFGSNRVFTREGRFAFDDDTQSDVVFDDIYYRFPLGDKARVQVWVNGTELGALLDPVSPFAPSDTEAISRFGRYNPLYRFGQKAALALDFNLTDWLNVAGAYTAGEANESGVGSGVFNGDYAMAGQVTLKPFNGWLKVAGLFVHGYRDDGIDMRTGTLASAFRVRNPAVSSGINPVVTNSYGVNANFGLTDQIFLGGWGGYTAARAVGTGDGDIWTWGSYLGIGDIGWAGNRLGFIFGREPYLAGSDASIGSLSADGLGNALGNRADDDASFHYEAFYQIAVSKNIQITPGIIVITNPGAQSVNPTLWIGTLRTTFTF